MDPSGTETDMPKKYYHQEGLYDSYTEGATGKRRLALRPRGSTLPSLHCGRWGPVVLAGTECAGLTTLEPVQAPGPRNDHPARHYAAEGWCCGGDLAGPDEEKANVVTMSGFGNDSVLCPLSERQPFELQESEGWVTL